MPCSPPCGGQNTSQHEQPATKESRTMFRRVCSILSIFVCLGAGVTTALAQPAQPALPQVFLDTPYPAQAGQVITVNSGGDLQAAINAANPGDTIQLRAGATFTPIGVTPMGVNVAPACS